MENFIVETPLGKFYAVFADYEYVSKSEIERNLNYPEHLLRTYNEKLKKLEDSKNGLIRFYPVERELKFVASKIEYEHLEASVRYSPQLEDYCLSVSARRVDDYFNGKFSDSARKKLEDALKETLVKFYQENYEAMKIAAIERMKKSFVDDLQGILEGANKLLQSLKGLVNG